MSSPPSCPFCTIAHTYPPILPKPLHPSPPPDPTLLTPSTHLVHSTPLILAFLDIMPMTHGHVLLATRAHREKLTDVTTEEARALGEWLSVLSRVVGRVVGVVDWNVVQNNGARAAQVVPHVHFHIIPRPATNNVPEIKNKSWTMFGRGQREELDDEVAVVLAKNLRREIAIEIGQGLGRKREKL